MTCKNGVWDGYDLTHPFLDDRSSLVRGPSVLTTIEQEATLRTPIANVPMPQPFPPAHHLVIQPQTASVQSTSQAAYLPNVHGIVPPAAQMAPYASAPAANATHMVLSTLQQEPEGSSPMTSARVQTAQSSALSLARSSIIAPDMSHRTPSEQEVIRSLQAVANYPESREFVKTMSKQLPRTSGIPPCSPDCTWPRAFGTSASPHRLYKCATMD